MSFVRDCQKWIQLYIEKTGNQDYEMHDVVLFAVTNGCPVPDPDPMKILERRFSRAARQKTRYDRATGLTYRAYHSYPAGGGKQTRWFDIDQTPPPPRKKMLASLTKRREQMVGDACSLDNDAEYWNTIRAEFEDSIQMQFDFTFDVTLARHHRDAEAGAAAS